MKLFGITIKIGEWLPPGWIALYDDSGLVLSNRKCRIILLPDGKFQIDQSEAPAPEQFAITLEQRAIMINNLAVVHDLLADMIRELNQKSRKELALQVMDNIRPFVNILKISFCEWHTQKPLEWNP